MAEARPADAELRGVTAKLEHTERRLALALEMLDLDGLVEGRAQRAPARSPSVEDLALLLGHDLAEEPINGRPAPGVAYSVESFARGFAASYFIRAGIGTLTRAVQLVSKRNWKELLDLNSFLSEKSLVYRVDAVRWGLAVGGFNLTYHLLRGVLARHVGSTLRTWAHAKPPPADHRAGVPLPEHTIIAAAAAGLSLLAHERSARRTVALYALARAIQSAYHTKARRRLVPDESLLARILGADHWLFCLACGQIQYAYVMRPELLGKRYYSFIVKNGPIDATVLQAVRNSCRGHTVDIQALHAYALKHGNERAARDVLEAGPHMRAVPLSAMHPRHQGSVAGVLDAFRSTFGKVFPLYFSIHAVPFLIFNTKTAVKQPVSALTRALVSGARSASFLGAFCTTYFAVVAAHRKLFPRDHKALYFVAGTIAGLAVYIEKQTRRSELTMYVLPRAIDAAYQHLRSRKLLSGVPYGDVYVFSASVAVLMYCYEHEDDAVAPLLRRVLSRLVSPKKAAGAVVAAPLPAPRSPAKPAPA